MAYSEIYTAATDANHILRQQVAVACSKAAADIFNEAASTENHNERIKWSRRVNETTGPERAAASMIWKVLGNATIQAAPTTANDSDVQFVVNGLVEDRKSVV